MIINSSLNILFRRFFLFQNYSFRPESLLCQSIIMATLGYFKGVKPGISLHLAAGFGFKTTRNILIIKYKSGA